MTTMIRLTHTAFIVGAVMASGCASTSPVGYRYNPTMKFARMAPAQSMQITGSRLRTTVSPDDPRPPTASPVSVITRVEIEQSGETSMRQLLLKRVPNMIRSKRE